MYYLIVFLLLLATELVYFRVADEFSIIDKPNERSSHSRVTIRGGGIIFVLGVMLYSLSNHFEYLWFVIGLMGIAGISFLDDIKGVTPVVRLFFHFIALWLLFYQWGLYGWPWWGLIMLWVLCVGIINVYNFMDGINGLTGGYSFVVVGCLAYVNRYITLFAEPELIGVVLVSLLVFNWFNFRLKACCFAGDTGAIAMAFIILFLLGKLILKTGEWEYLILLGVYGADSVLTIIHRLILRENISLPHRKHLYQLMANELKIPHIIVALAYMMLQALIFTGYILCQAYRLEYFVGILLVLCGGYVWFMRKYFHLHPLNRGPRK